MLCVTSILLNSLGFLLWLRIYCILLNVPCALDKNVDLLLLGAAFYKYQLDPVGCQFFYILADFLAISCWEWSVQTSNHNCWILSFSFEHCFCFVYFGTLLLDLYIYNCYLFPVGCPSVHMKRSSSSYPFYLTLR